jgi:hypothetical protein
MNNDKSTYRGRRWPFGVMIIVVILLFLATGVRLALKSAWLFDLARDIAIEQAGDYLNGSLSIESIRGDLLNGFVIRDLHLRDEQDGDVVRIDSVSVRYRLMSLIRSPHELDDLSVYGTDIFVSQKEDSTWNVQNLVRETEEEIEEGDPVYWSLQNIGIYDLNADVRSEYLLPDGFLNIDNLNAGMTLGAGEDGFFALLNHLDFSLREARLPEPVAVYLEGSSVKDRITLESLVLNTGRTVLNASAEYREAGELEQHTELSPLSWQDLALYVDDLPLQQNLDIRLGAEGTLDNLNLSLFVTADGLDELNLSVVLDAADEPVFKEINLKTTDLNLPRLTGMDDLPVLQNVEIHGSGNLMADRPEESDWKGELLVEGAAYDIYLIDRFHADYDYSGQNVSLLAELTGNGQRLDLSASVRDLFDEMPGWELELTSNQMNIAEILQNEELESDLNLRLNLNGAGFDPEQFTTTAELVISGNRFGDQEFSELRFNGTADPYELQGFLMGRLDQSIIETDFTAANWMDDPSYRFTAVLKEFNLAEIGGMEELPTSLNGTFSGEGSSFDPEQLQLFATARFDSSIVNGEVIETLSLDLEVEDQFLHIDDGTLESPIADAVFTVKQHIIDVTNSSNTLQFDAIIKDLYPLTPILGFERLEAPGTIRGYLARNEEGVLQFDGSVELEHVYVDTLFNSEKISGTVTAFIQDEPEADIHIELTQPTVYDTGVQDLQFGTYITIAENETFGSLNILLQNGDQSSISHSGNYRVDSTAVRLTTQTLEFVTQLRTLSLIEPFDLSWADDVLRVDTLTIASDDDEAFLSLWVPHVDSLTQHVGLDARTLNLGELQETILEESFFEGYLSGAVEAYNSPDNLEVKATGLLSYFRFGEGEMDSLRFDAGLEEEWLEAELHSWHLGEKLAEGFLRIPFIPGDPLTFDEHFFEREIEGEFVLLDTDLNYWFSFLPEGAPEETEGVISMHAELGGVAGSPELNGNLDIRQGLFSGITIDRFGMDLAYQHEEETVHINGSVVKDNRSILGIDAMVPFHVDLQRGEVLLPEDEDSVFVDFRTDDFDLALLNNYVDPDLIRQLTGRLEGNVTLSGRMANLETTGQMQLTRGNMRIVPAGITLADMAANILFEPDRITLQQFSTRSGPGRLRALGNVELDALTPGNINFEITANQFRAANTPEYNFLVNMRANLTGTAQEPDLGGSLTFLQSQVNLQNFGERAVEDVVLEEEEEPEPSEFFESLAMEFSVDFGRQFLIRNRQYLDMELMLGGQLDLVKQRREEMQMFGTLEGVRGFARPLGRNFELDEAIVAFSGPPDNPDLNITTRYSPPQAAGVHIYYIIEGTLEDPEFRFDSEPALELQDIVSYTLFGKPFYELESWEQVVAGSGTSPTAADFALEVLLDRVEMLASQRLGIDVVQIDNTRSGSGSTTSIKTGWYLNQRTFFAILNEVGGARPKTLFTLEYLLRENLELIITQGDDSREGVDLRWKLDY